MAKREYENPIEEILDRTRRMETKVTKLLDHAGLNTDGMHAIYTGHALEIPSISISVKEVLDAMPMGVELPLMLEGVVIAYIMKPSTISER